LKLPPRRCVARHARELDREAMLALGCETPIPASAGGERDGHRRHPEDCGGLPRGVVGRLKPDSRPEAFIMIRVPFGVGWGQLRGVGWYRVDHPVSPELRRSPP